MNSEQLRAVLSSQFTSSVIYRVIYASPQGSTLVELQIRQLQGGCSVHKITANRSGSSNEALISKATLDEAKDQLKEECLCLEQSGYDWFSEPQGYDLVDLSLYSLKATQPVCLTGQSFFAAHHSESVEYLSQALPGGIRLLLQHDSNGKVMIRPSLQAEAIELTGELEAQALSLFAFEGFRGALLDTVIHNHKLYVVDAMYFGDQWIDELPVTRRLGFVLDTMKTHGIDSSAVIRPIVVSPTDWLRINDHAVTRGLAIRRNDSIPLYSRETTAGQLHGTTYLVSQKAHARITLLKTLGQKMLFRSNEDDYRVEQAGPLPYYYNFHEQQMSLLAKGPTEPLMAM